MRDQKTAGEVGVAWRCGACARATCGTCRKEHSLFSKAAQCPACNAKVAPSAYLDSSLYGVRPSSEVLGEMSRYIAAPRGKVQTFMETPGFRSWADVTDLGQLVAPIERAGNSLVDPEAAASGVLTMRPHSYGDQGKEWALKLLPLEGNEALWEYLIQCGVPIQK